jgi:hypothetical protein
MSWKRTVLVLSFIAGFAAAVQAQDRITPPAVPADIAVADGYSPFLRGHAVGTQNYICAPASTPSGRDWLFIGPQATLFDDDGKQIMTHFQSRNPDAAGAIQATWQHSRDTSAVWATKFSGSLDPNFVAPGAIEWLRLDVSGSEFGPAAGDKLERAAFIQRINTIGGVKPASAECTAAAINTRRLVPYQADYYFYR